ncbi:unnamed protein product, partial [Allacma fusca]
EEESQTSQPRSELQPDLHTGALFDHASSSGENSQEDNLLQQIYVENQSKSLKFLKFI